MNDASYTHAHVISDLGLCLTAFPGRYSEGIIVALTSQPEHAAVLNDNFTGGSLVWETVSSLLAQLEWFPIIFVENHSSIITALDQKLETISVTQPLDRDWKLGIELMCSIIEQDRHHNLVSSMPREFTQNLTAAAIDFLFTVRDADSGVNK